MPAPVSAAHVRPRSSSTTSTPRIYRAGQRARILYMTTIPLSEARSRLSELVDEAVRTHQRVDITRNGRRAAVLMSADDFDSLEETLEILSDPQLMQELAEADEQIKRGEVYSQEEVEASMRAAGRWPRR
jgi:antitoxin YefM